MCVWSAYTGKKCAAPILWESLQKIEGIWGGYYTGIVTAYQGKLQLGKVIGDTGVWKKKFQLENFPGNCGLIHSRTNSGGDERWGQPFTGSAGKVAVIAQGSPGIFKESVTPLFEKRGNEMLAENKHFSSAIFGLPKRYPVLADGGQVHSTEVMLQTAEYWYEKLGDPLQAVRKAASELTIESASLFLFADRPEVIVFANANQHMVYQVQPDGIMLSISALGLPGTCGMELPCNSIGIITPDSIQIGKLADCYETLMEIPAGAFSASWEFIQANPGCLLGNVTDKVLKGMFPPGTLNFRVGCAYRILENLVLDGKVRLEKSSSESSSGTPGTLFKLFPVL